MRSLTLAALVMWLGCSAESPAVSQQTEEQPYKWAFAQDMDGTLKQNEYCREFLAASLYSEGNKANTFREAGTNVFVFRGSIESYRVYAFKTQAECETALTSMVQRQALRQ